MNGSLTAPRPPAPAVGGDLAMGGGGGMLPVGAAEEGAIALDRDGGLPGYEEGRPLALMPSLLLLLGDLLFRSEALDPLRRAAAPVPLPLPLPLPLPVLPRLLLLATAAPLCARPSEPSPRPRPRPRPVPAPAPALVPALAPVPAAPVLLLPGVLPRGGEEGPATDAAGGCRANSYLRGTPLLLLLLLLPPPPFVMPVPVPVGVDRPALLLLVMVELLVGVALLLRPAVLLSILRDGGGREGGMREAKGGRTGRGRRGWEGAVNSQLSGLPCLSEGDTCHAALRSLCARLSRSHFASGQEELPLAFRRCGVGACELGSRAPLQPEP